MSGPSIAPLLLLPGLLCDARVWPAELLSLTRPVIAPMGYGDADSMEAMAERAMRGAPERVSLLGHSMGARVALEIVRRHPERVERLALVSTGVHLPRPGEANARHALLDLGRAEGAEALVDRWLPPMLARNGREDQALVQRLRAMCVQAGVEVFAHQIKALLHRPDVQRLLPGIDCPTLVLVGSEDQWSPPGQHHEIAAAIPGADLTVVEGAGHMLPQEAPEAFVAAVKRWLSAEPASASLSRVA